MWPSSLAFRLLLTTLVWSLVVLVIAGVSLLALYRQSALQNFERILDVSLLNLIASVDTAEDGRILPGFDLGDPRFSSFRSGWSWQITPINQVDKATRSPSLAGEAITPPEPSAIPFDAGFRRSFPYSDDAGNLLRAVEQLATLGEGGEVASFVVTGSLQDVEQDIATFRDRLILFLTMFGVGLVASTVLVVVVGLRPLDRIRESLARIRAGDTARLEGNFPSEIAPLASELNALIEANRKVVERARTQVGNLAHGLKTPLTVLTNEADHHSGALADRVADQVAAMRYQLDYYLDRARIAAGGTVIGVVTDVDPLVARLVRIMPRMHQDRDITLTTDLEQRLKFQGESQDLEELLGNLIDNAFKWAATEVRLSLHRTHARDRAMLVFTVEDDGPGLSPEQCAEAVRRGQRLDESKPGSGLGLSIVADLADLYGGSFDLDRAPLGGLRARLTLPAADIR
ncbi:MAG: HAMP domain-containing sensor histidine kinase [Pseudomonadota bacterium]